MASRIVQLLRGNEELLDNLEEIKRYCLTEAG